MLIIRDYQENDEKEWVYTKALSYLFSPFFDDMERSKTPLDADVFDDRIALVAIEDNRLVGLLDIDIYNSEYSRSYAYAPANKVAYFTNLAVHPDYQGQGIAQGLYEIAKERLLEQDVDKLVIFTREGDVANYLYQKWGGQLVCQDTLVIGRPKDRPDISFSVNLDAKQIALQTDGRTVPYYLREGVYILANKEDLALFDVETTYEEVTYVIDLVKA